MSKSPPAAKGKAKAKQTAPLLNGDGAVFSLDIGTHLGWAIVANDRVQASGSINLQPKAAEVPGHRYLRLARWLDQQHQLLPPGAVVVLEDVRSHTRRDAKTGKAFVGIQAAHVYGGLRAIIEAWAASKRLPVHPVGVGSWKSGIGLSGPHASKEAVLQQVRLLGYQPGTQDEADAMGVGLHGARTLRWQGLGSA